MIKNCIFNLSKIQFKKVITSYSSNKAIINYLHLKNYSKII